MASDGFSTTIQQTRWEENGKCHGQGQHTLCCTSQHIQAYNQTTNSFQGTMNQQQQYLESQQSQMSAGQSYPSSTAAGSISQYSSYQYQQPPVLQPGPGNYQAHYAGYSYPNDITIVGNIPQSVGYSLGTAAGFGVSSNAWVFLERVYSGDLLVIDNSWIGGLFAMLSLRNIYFHLRTKKVAEAS